MVVLKEVTFDSLSELTHAELIAFTLQQDDMLQASFRCIESLHDERDSKGEFVEVVTKQNK